MLLAVKARSQEALDDAITELLPSISKENVEAGSDSPSVLYRIRENVQGGLINRKCTPSAAEAVLLQSNDLIRGSLDQSLNSRMETASIA